MVSVCMVSQVSNVPKTVQPSLSRKSTPAAAADAQVYTIDRQEPVLAPTEMTTVEN